MKKNLLKVILLAGLFTLSVTSVSASSIEGNYAFNTLNSPINKYNTHGHGKDGSEMGDGSGGNRWDIKYLGTNDEAIVQADISAVPLPSAVWLFGAALLGFIGMSRRTEV